MKLTARMFEKMKQSAAEAFARLDAGESSFHVAVEMYRSAFPERSQEEAEAVALRIGNQVRQYNHVRDAALADGTGWIDEQIEALCAGRPRLERCRLMAQMIDGMMMMSGDASGEFTPGRQAQAYTEENVNRQVEAGLRERLRQAVAGTGLNAGQMGELEKLLEDCDIDEAAELVLDFGEKQQDVDAVYAMIAYLNGQNHVRGFDSRLTPETAAVAVCAAGDKLRTARRVSVGEITAETGSKVLRAIGSVAGFLVDLALCLLVGGAVFMALGALSVWFDFCMAVVIAGAAAAAVLTGVALFSGTVKLGQKAALLPAKLIKCVAGLLVKGWKAIAAAVRDRTAKPMRITVAPERAEAPAEAAEPAPEPVVARDAEVEAPAGTVTADA